MERKLIQLNPIQTDQTYFYWLGSKDYVKILYIKEEINPAQFDQIWTLDWINKRVKKGLMCPHTVASWRDTKPCMDYPLGSVEKETQSAQTQVAQHTEYFHCDSANLTPGVS